MTEVFTREKLERLKAKLDPSDIKSRKGPGGKDLNYLSGDHVIEVANDLIGFGQWDAETVEMKREHDPVQIPPSNEYPKGAIVVTYSAKVRVTVYSEDGSRKIVRERWGGHRGFGATVGEAIENCIKAAETDATKRAFVTFGNQFGLALYDKSGKNIGRDEPKQIAQGTERPMAPIDQGFDDNQAPQPSISSRAVAMVAKPNGHPPQTNGAMRY